MSLGCKNWFIRIRGFRRDNKKRIEVSPRTFTTKKRLKSNKDK